MPPTDHLLLYGDSFLYYSHDGYTTNAQVIYKSILQVREHLRCTSWSPRSRSRPRHTYPLLIIVSRVVAAMHIHPNLLALPDSSSHYEMRRMGNLNNIVSRRKCAARNRMAPNSVTYADMCCTHEYVFVTGIGQSSSVMLDQKIQTVMTERRVKSVSKRAPSILPLVPLQMCMLTT